MSEPESLGSIISKSRIKGRKKGKQRLDLLKANWAHIVGDRMAEHCEPRKLSRGELVVAADGGSWASELAMTTERMLARIEKIMCDRAVKKIKVQARDITMSAAGRAAEEKAERAADLDRELEGGLGEEIGAMADQEMKSALVRLMRASKACEQNDHASD